MASDRPRKIWSRVGLIGSLTGAKAQIAASAGVGLLVWDDVLNVKIPLYFLNKIVLIAKEVAAFVVADALRIISDILDHFEKSKFSIADTAHIAVAIAIFYLGYRFFRRIWRALKKIHPAHWEIWPRVGLRRKLLLISLLAAGTVAAWQLGAFPWIGSQLFELGRQTIGLLSLQNISNIGHWLWQGFVSIYENKATVFPVVKGAIAALATYATLAATRVVVDLLLPVVGMARTVYSHAYPWLPEVKLSQRQRDWLYGMGSVAGGLIFGFSDLSFPSVPVWAWAALAPGLFLFAKERPNLVSAISKSGLTVGRCLHKSAEFTLAQPRWAAGIVAAFAVGTVAVGALFSSHPFLGFAIISGVVKAAYVGTTLALLIAAGSGLAVLTAHTRQVAGLLTVRSCEAGYAMLRTAAKITNPFMKLGRATVAVMLHAKARKREQVLDKTAFSMTSGAIDSQRFLQGAGHGAIRNAGPVRVGSA
jgi:hypothetical protein